jgi:hypothetical protein
MSDILLPNKKSSVGKVSESLLAHYAEITIVMTMMMMMMTAAAAVGGIFSYSVPWSKKGFCSLSSLHKRATSTARRGVPNNRRGVIKASSRRHVGV